MNHERVLGHMIQADIKTKEPMSLHTSWKVGGPADYFVSPHGPADLQVITRYSIDHDLPLFVFGNGTNLLVLDGGIRGLVVQIGSSFNYLKWKRNTVTVGAGTPMPLLARAAAAKGMAGVEFAGGIPGTLGGALVMNAGAFGGYIGNVVRGVKLVGPAGDPYTMKAGQLEFGYRSSNLTGRGIITEAELELDESDSQLIKEKVDSFLTERLRRHPQLPSAGSVFRNLPGRPAGELIEQAGCKGMRMGNAQVSEQHANFIVNLGGATAEEILALIRAVQQKVKEEFNIDLHPEVRVIGEEN